MVPPACSAVRRGKETRPGYSCGVTPRALITVAALLLAGCSATSAQYVRRGQLCEAIEAAEDEHPPLERQLDVAILKKSEILVHLHLLSQEEVKAELGLLPDAFLHDHRLLRYRVEARRTTAEVRVYIDALSTARQRYTPLANRNKADLMALLVPRPEAEAAPKASNLRRHFFVDGVVRLLTLNKGKLKDLDKKIDRFRRSTWQGRKERRHETWSDAVLSDPARRAALAKLEQYMDIDHGDAMKAGTKLEGLLLLERGKNEPSHPRGLSLTLRTELPCGDDPLDGKIYRQPLIIPLTDPEALEAGLNARFARGARPLTELIR
jgi:hypothetical protein